jgi:hypothetical protein
METVQTLNPQYVTDADGRRTGVLLSLDAFERLLHDLSALAAEADPSETEWARAARQSAVFADLADPADDLYSADDGVPFQP